MTLLKECAGGMCRLRLTLGADGQTPKRRGPKPDSKPALTRRQELNRQAQRYSSGTDLCLIQTANISQNSSRAKGDVHQGPRTRSSTPQGTVRLHHSRSRLGSHRESEAQGAPCRSWHPLRQHHAKEWFPRCAAAIVQWKLKRKYIWQLCEYWRV